MKQYLALVLMLCLLVGCGGEPTPTPDAAATQIAAEEAAYATMTAEASTPTPTQTPTHTPTPTVTPTWTPVSPTSPPKSKVAAAVATQTRATDGMVMVYVPAGEFVMGTSDAYIDAILPKCIGCTRELFADEQPQHVVYLDAFWIDKTEVTNAQYGKCVAAGACVASKLAQDAMFSGSAQPVVGVSWYDARAYCQWAGARLPSEAEWEKAARGEDARTYPWGDWDTERHNGWESRLGGTTPVGQYSPVGDSPYGCADMAGNVAEWTGSLYKYYPYDPTDGREDPEASDDLWRVLRGGGFDNFGFGVRCAHRGKTWPDLSGEAIGFRCLVDPG
jgi:formylglycine-generating enzyme required for sulfatase activity